MKRCYNAGKIGQLSEQVWTAKFEAARQEIVSMGFIPVCPTQQRHAHDRTWLSYMREDLTALLSCDVVFAQRDWQESPGATIEVNTAKSLGIEIIYQN